MTKFQRGIVVASALVTVMGGWASTARAADGGGACGIIYTCATEPGCQFGSGPCNAAKQEMGCTGVYSTSWCSLVGCYGDNAIACQFI